MTHPCGRAVFVTACCDAGAAHTRIVCAGGKRSGILFSHCRTQSCRSLQCRSARNVCTFTGLQHRHLRRSKQNDQSLPAASMPRRIAAYVADCLRHSVMNITVSRLPSLSAHSWIRDLLLICDVMEIGLTLLWCWLLIVLVVVGFLLSASGEGEQE